jgi:two-component sensor histidine kinase
MLSRLGAGQPHGVHLFSSLFRAGGHHEIPVMTSADSVDLQFSRRLNRGLRHIASAAGTEAVLRATALAAHDLSNAAGLCAISKDLSDGAIATFEDSAVTVLDSNSSLQRLIVAAARGDEAIVQYRPLLEVELAAGRRLSTQTLLTVPLSEASGLVGLAFFWSDGVSPSPEQLAVLPGLAWTSSLALRSQQNAAELQRSHSRRRAEIGELQHRARNVLALVRSIIRRSGESAESSEEFAGHLEGRIGAVARLQGALSIDGGSGPELEDVIRTELTANAVREGQLTIAGPSLRLASRAAETIALTLHELTTNALKFGALTVPEGRIAVSWKIATGPSATLHWSWIESNVRIAQLSQRRGFGRELIENVLPYELGAVTRFTIAPGGLCCEIDLPLNARTAAFVDGAHHDGRSS